MGLIFHPANLMTAHLLPLFLGEVAHKTLVGTLAPLFKPNPFLGEFVAQHGPIFNGERFHKPDPIPFVT